jgi:MFS family permease
MDGALAQAFRPGPSNARLTVEEQLERVGFGRLQALALGAFVLIIMSDGMELVVTNIIWPQLPARAWGIEPDSGTRGMLVSVSFSGFVFGTLMSAALGDLVGRRPLIFIHSGIFIPMSLFSAAADSLAQLTVTRFFVGVSMGIVFPAVCSMSAEYSPKEWRARCVVAMPGIAYSLGQVLVLVTGIILIRISEALLPAGEATAGEYCKSEDHEEDFMRCAWWRFMLAVGVVPDLIAVHSQKSSMVTWRMKCIRALTFENIPCRS